MTSRVRLFGFLAVLSVASASVSGQAGPGLFVPRNVQRAIAAKTRTTDGRPGPAYWQNTASYDIDVTVAPPSRRVTAREQIKYANNSPYPLKTITFKLYLNIHKPEALREDPVTPAFLTGGITIDAFRVNGAVKDWAKQPGFQGITTHTVTLDEPLAAGASVTFDLAWHYDLSTQNWKEGVVDDTTFFLAYFFPRVAVVDDIDLAFDPQEFSSRRREYYNDFSDFTVSVHVPRNFAVWATGDLQNPDEVLQPTYAQRLKASFTADAVTTIATPDEMRRGVVTAQTKDVKWTWRAANVPDFALGISDHYVWDAASVVVDPATGRRVSVQAAYNVEATDFKRGVEFATRALTFGSSRYPGVPYPYSKMTLFRGDADEEYPMMANDASVADNPTFTRFVAAHEILHSWFPFYMGINEQRYPFMDEGWTTAFEYLFEADVDGQAAADELYRKFRTPYLMGTTSEADLPIVTPFDAMKAGGFSFSNNAYIKPALAYLALRELLGDELFTKALREFVARWHGKHPWPWDMFNTFSDVSGRDLRWFFRRWFFERSFIDLAVTDVTTAGRSCAVRVANVGGSPIPFDLVLTFDDGSTERFHFTPAVWQDAGAAATLHVAVAKAVKSVVVDDGIFADATAPNNTWPRQ